MPEQVALDAVARLPEEMDGRHLGIDLELAEGGEKEILRGHFVRCRIGIAEQELVAGCQHDVDRFPVDVDHHFVITIERRGGLQHIREAARSVLRPGIKKNCLIARQF